jgi:hypothetical protein
MLQELKEKGTTIVSENQVAGEELLPSQFLTGPSKAPAFGLRARQSRAPCIAGLFLKGDTS